MHLEELRATEEDWTGLRDAAERRRLQNRLNARARRRRKARDAAESRAASLTGAAELRWIFENCDGETLEKYEPTTAVSDEPLSPLIQLFHRVFGLRTGQGYRLPKGYTAATFPLSSDHLMPLLQYNLKRAAVTNLAMLFAYSATSSLDWIHKDCSSLAPELALFPSNPHRPDAVYLPPALVPTELQRQVPHPPWVDIIPIPSIRDQVIRAVADSGASGFDAEELRLDLAGVGKPIPTRLGLTELPCIVVWDTPWSPSGFEVTQAFVRKWGQLLIGCNELMRATNRWRALRGEKPLIIVEEG